MSSRAVRKALQGAEGNQGPVEGSVSTVEPIVERKPVNLFALMAEVEEAPASLQGDNEEEDTTHEAGQTANSSSNNKKNNKNKNKNKKNNNAGKGKETTVGGEEGHLEGEVKEDPSGAEGEGREAGGVENPSQVAVEGTTTTNQKKKKKKGKGKGPGGAKGKEEAGNNDDVDGNDNDGHDGKGKKGLGAPTGGEESEDEIDKALRELGDTKNKGPSVSRALKADGRLGSPSSGPVAVRGPVPVLVLDAKDLHPKQELVRLFGQEAVRDASGPDDAGGSRRGGSSGRGRLGGRGRSRGRGASGGGGGGGPASLKKTILIKPNVASWVPGGASGLSMELLSAEGSSTDLTFAFRYDDEYLEAQEAFYLCVMTMDVDGLLEAAGNSPYHTDTLLQISEIARQRDQLPQAAELIEQAVYGRELAFHPSFDVTSGQCRLPYHIRENRGFFIALFRHIINLGRRGCPRTALECSKLLFSLDPKEDPVGSLLFLDYFGIRSGEFEYLLEFNKTYSDRLLHLMPNWAYSLALAQRELALAKSESLDAANRALDEAIIRFPGVVPLLAAKTDFGRTFPPFLAAPTTAPPQPVSMLSKLYVERAAGVWRGDEKMEWVLEGARRVQARVSAGDPEVQSMEAFVRAGYSGESPLSVNRHVILTDITSVMQLLPQSAVEHGIHVFDPLPPDGLPEALERRTHPEPVEINQSILRDLLTSLLPWAGPGGGV